jgi:solute carrier family 25 (mitochondrial phosphate transporter), member 23/24/25/41
MQSEGLLAFWKGNAANAVRVFPYAAAQLAMNDLLKRQLMPVVRARCAAPSSPSRLGHDVSHPYLVFTLPAFMNHHCIAQVLVVCAGHMASL